MLGYYDKDVVLFAVMIAAECSNVGVTTLFKAATDRGLSYYVYIVYSYLISTLLLLLPLPFIIPRSTRLPSNLSSLLFRIFLLGAIDVVASLCGYRGLEYSSPTVASAASSLVPAFTFILAVVFRMEKADLRSSTTQAKIVGSIVSISVWYIVQAQILKLYPEELIVVMLYNLCATLISAPVCFLAEPRLSAWILRPDITMVSVIYSGIFYSCVGILIHSCCIRLKGPVYVSVFKPLSVAIAAASTVIFLGEALYLGSVVGAIILSIGFYAVLWGKAKEGQIELSEENAIICLRTPSSSSETPLLQSFKVEDNRETMAVGGKS
ncbi:hypothetical protein L6164_006567 [Bauhinia variegata]|uniref:Uncharacterized protein n=1 Tax=Bauhinia variegata TaxID=167791 RepID=A0ACB9PUC0_BAUVA|nr:hypothetical protein L6164_006567 [Bauhinia variegata]